MLAGRRRALVLPDRRRGQDATVGPVECHDGLALVGDADGRHVDIGVPFHHLGQGLGHRPPDLLRVMLDPSRGGVRLGELAVGDVDDGARDINEEGADAGGSGVDGDHGGHVARRYRLDRWVSPRRYHAQTFANGL